MGGTAAGSEHFARGLRELKERSGLSYGQLATRLHVSTSTLHRYCNGDAVPTDYAVVERLARLCGAGREELVELHRRWVLADAVRRVGNRGGGAAGPEPGEQPDRDRERAAGSGTRIAPAGRMPAGRMPAGPAHLPDPETAPDPEIAPEATRTAAAPAPAATTPSAPPKATPTAPPKAPAELEPVGAVPPPRRPRSWRRRVSRPAVAGSVAALVLTGVTMAVTDSTGSEGLRGRASPSSPARLPAHSARSDASVSAPAPSGGTGTVPASPGTSPSGRAPSTEPSGQATPSVPRSPDGGTPARPPAPAQPLVWSVRSHVWQNGCSHRYLIDRPPSAVPPPPVSQDARAWAAALGAVHGATTIVEATISAKGAAPVVVQALHIRVPDRREPLRWSSYSMDNGCGGALTPAEYAVDLDAARPQAQPRDGSDSEHTLPAVRLPYQVTASDPLVLRVHARTVHCDCDWYLELEWSAGGRSDTVRIDDGGRPFRTSGVKGRPEYNYWSPGDGWTRS
ncbi:helix-turn-helix domain-containing protein [Actinacidiphila sp. bgisy167]|uniref:helix-turn-helix domain-containing protein n=1 Tax=Actinacidiphila sp. bgisy167 TaxID=3413797 RepID=UPI003D718369